MRKRVIIGLLAVVVIGMAGSVLLKPEPEPGTVEYHKRQFCAAQDRLWGRSPDDRVKNVVETLTGNTVAAGISLDRYAEVKFQRKALMDLEYLEERTIAVAHPRPREIERRTMIAARGIVPEERLRFATFIPGTNYQTDPITIICPREDMPIWEDLIRKAEVPESGK